MSNRVLERDVKRSIVDALNSFPRCTVFPISTTGVFDPRTRRFRRTAGRRGTPDLLVCYRGRFLGLEVKTPKGRATPEQIEALESVNLSGGIGVIVRSVDEVIQLLRRVDLDDAAS